MRPYARGPSPQSMPYTRQPGATTTLRANAPTFVPGGAHMAATLPRRPASEDRRRSDDRVADAGHPSMPRPASSGSVGMSTAQPEADQEMATVQPISESDEKSTIAADEQPSSDQVSLFDCTETHERANHMTSNSLSLPCLPTILIYEIQHE